MAARGAAQILRERIGVEATDALSTMMNESSRSMAEEIVRALDERFERRLTEGVSVLNQRLTAEISGLNQRLTAEISGVNQRLTGEISGLTVEMHKGFGELRAEIANGKSEVIRWAFLFWLGQFGAVCGFLSYLK